MGDDGAGRRHALEGWTGSGLAVKGVNEAEKWR